jgi:hypothetical protein
MSLNNLPVEILVEIFLYTETLIIKSTCKYWNSILNQNKYNVSNILSFKLSQKKQLNEIPIEVLEKLSKEKNNLEIILRKMDTNNFYINNERNNKRISQIIDYFDRINSYKIVSKTCNENHTYYDYIFSIKSLDILFTKLLEYNFDELLLLILKITKIYGYMNEILLFVSKFNKVDLFKKILNECVPKNLNIDFLSCCENFTLANNIEGVIFLLEKSPQHSNLNIYHVCLCAIKFKKNRIFNKFKQGLSFENKILMINYSIYFNNIYVYDIIMTNNFIELLIKSRCNVFYNYKRYNISYFKAIALSSSYNSTFFYRFLDKTQNYNFNLIKYSYYLFVHNRRMINKSISSEFDIEQKKYYKNNKKKESKARIKLLKLDNKWIRK